MNLYIHMSGNVSLVVDLADLQRLGMISNQLSCRMTFKGASLGELAFRRKLMLSVRFARLSRLKLILGAAPEDIEYPEFEWQKLVVDEDYLVLDLVLNWVRLSGHLS